MYGNNIGDGTCMNLITATRLPLNSRGSEDLRTRCCKNHPTLNGLPINIDGAHFQRACLLSLHSPQVVDLRLLSVDAFSVMCQLQYHYLMYWDSQFYVLGLSVRILRTVNRYHYILPAICLKAYSTSTRTMS